MPRIPVIVPRGSFGTQNALAPTTGRSVPATTVKMPAGPAQIRARFAASEGGFSQEQARQLNALQDSIAYATRLVKSVPFLDGNLAQSQSFGAGGSVVVAHGLGRNWQGYDVRNIQASSGTPGPFRALPAGGALDSRQLTIVNTGAACTADVWVY